MKIYPWRRGCAGKMQWSIARKFISDVINDPLLTFYCSKVATCIRTLQRAADAVQEKIQWNVTILAGGPDPKRGGDVHVIA
jgi:hypothetical protein